MLEATSKKKKIDEARKELEDGSKNDDEDDDGGGLQIKGDLKSDYEHILQLDPYPDPIDLEARVSMLNADQRRVYDEITSHLPHLQKHEKQECACTELKALNMFVSGVGGTGKSFLIQAIRAFVRATWPDTDNTTAAGGPTGLAACNVNGMTTYQLFQLPVEHEGKTAQYWPLPKDSLKFLRIQLKNVKVFIIDEISMVSSLNLAYIYLRLEEIFGADEWFGGNVCGGHSPTPSC